MPSQPQGIRQFALLVDGDDSWNGHLQWTRFSDRICEPQHVPTNEKRYVHTGSLCVKTNIVVMISYSTQKNVHMLICFQICSYSFVYAHMYYVICTQMFPRSPPPMLYEQRWDPGTGFEVVGWRPPKFPSVSRPLEATRTWRECAWQKQQKLDVFGPSWMWS